MFLKIAGLGQGRGVMQTSVAPDISSAVLPPELSRIVRLDDITQTANTLNIDATVGECMALAARFELSYVRNLSAEITYRRTRGGQMIRIDGRITATYGQLCGVTLAPMPLSMEESFQTEYTLDPWEKYSEFDLDQPEILTDDFIDMGEVVAEYFGLGIDPYARRPGAERLPELLQYLSGTLQELLAQPPQPEGEPMVVPVAADPEVVDMVFTDQAADAAADEPIIRSEAANTDIANDMPLPAESSETAPEYESLFMKYLRRLRAD